MFSSTISLTSSLDGGGFGRFILENDPVPIVQDAGRGINLRTVQPTASRYKNWAIAAHSYNITPLKTPQKQIM